MAIFERTDPRPSVDAHASSERLRVITAGHVGNMEARLGTSGFDVVAVADSEDALIDAVAADDADAIVVEADLCDSLERVRDLAPDAVLIVVGDHTPAGALGRIERGVSGTVMAGLLHALVADGLGAAVVWGLVPAAAPAAPAHVPTHVSTSALAAKAEVVRGQVAGALRGHGGVAAAAGTLAVSVSASILLLLPTPRTLERAERPIATTPVTQPAEQPSSPGFSTRMIDPRPPRHGQVPVADDGTAGATATGAGVRDDGPSKGDPAPVVDPVPPGDDEPPPGDGGSPPGDHPTPPDTTNATHPPGVANGWEHRPPKHGDNGNRNGWSKDRDERHDSSDHPGNGK